MAEMTERELLALVDSEFESAMGDDGGEIDQERAKAWNYYLSKKLGNEVQGQSAVTTSDVSDAIDGMMPSLLRIFTTHENLVDFEPHGKEDQEVAEQEADYVNYVFFKKNPAFLLIFVWMLDALIQKNGIVKAWWDDSEKVTEESYTGLSTLQFGEFLDDDELEPVERSERFMETVEVVATPQGPGQQIVNSVVHDVTFRRITKDGDVRVDNVPPAEFRISSDARSIFPDEARMVGQERDVTRSELIDMGFDRKLVENLPAVGQENTQGSSEEQARYDKTDDTQGTAHESSQEKVCFREAYIKVDFDDDGRSELRMVQTAGNQILKNEIADRQPFHVICPYILPHKHFGRSVADKLTTFQEVTTTITRQMLDNTYATNQPGHGVWDQGMNENTMDDLLTTRIGRVVTFSRPPGQSYTPLTVPYTAGTSFSMLEYFDRMGRERTGVSSDTDGLTPDALKNIQTTVMAQAQDLSKMKVETVARVFAETGFKTLFLHIHEMLLKHQEKAEIVKLRNKYVPVKPSEWKERKDMTVNIGLGLGSKEQKLLQLTAIGDIQKQMVEAGGLGVTVSPNNLYNTASEFVKLAQFKDPEKFFTDPEGKEFKRLPSETDKALQAQIQLETQKLQLQAAKLQLDREKAEVDKVDTLAGIRNDQEKLRIQMEEIQNDFAVAMNKSRDDMTKLEVESGANVPGAKV